jgi:hypothetical protein
VIGEIPAVLIDEGDDKIKVAPERYSSYQDVKSDCQAMIDADAVRAEIRAHVDNVVNNNRPISHEKLKKRNLTWFPNVAYGEMEGYLQAQLTPLWDLVCEVDHLIEVNLDIKGTKWEIEAKQDEIQKAYTWLMFKRWRKSFNYHFGLQQRELLVHGVGVHVRPHKNNWLCRTLRSGRCLFPEDTPLDFEAEGERFMVREFVPAHIAYQWIKNENTALALGWNPQAVLKTLAYSSKQKHRLSRTEIEEVLREIRRGDYGFTASRQSGFWINWLFCNEIDTGQISQYGVAEGYDPGKIGPKDRQGYLFKKRNRFDRWPISLFTLDIGDGTIHGVRGYGIRTVHFFELSNRIKNIMAAQVLIAALPQFKQVGEIVDPDKLKLLRMGALSIWPKGLDLQQVQFQSLNQGPLALSQELRKTLESNTQPFTGSTPEPKDRETAYSFGLRSQDAARVSNGMQSWYESDLQQWHEKTLEALIDTPKGQQPYQKMAEEFRDRCRKSEAKVTDDDLKHIAEVSEVTSSGAGSAAARLHGLTMLMQYVYPNTSPDRQINIERDITSNAMGNSKVDRYARSLADTEMPMADDSMAAVESSELSMGGDAVVSGSQNDVKHAASHIAKADQLKQAVEQGAIQPAKALEGLKRLLQHAGEHLARLQGNRMKKNEFDQLSQKWEEIAQFAQQLEEQIASEQEQAGQDDADISRKDKVAAADIQRKDTKAQADMALKFRKASLNERIADAKTAAMMVRQQRGNGQRQPAKAA